MAATAMALLDNYAVMVPSTWRSRVVITKP